MSAVRMCDRCGVIFKEGAEGATIATGSRNIRNERNGRLEVVTITQDVCPECSGSVTEVTPRLAIAATPKPATDATVVEDQGEAAIRDAVAAIRHGSPLGASGFDGVNDSRD